MLCQHLERTTLYVLSIGKYILKPLKSPDKSDFFKYFT